MHLQVDWRKKFHWRIRLGEIGVHAERIRLRAKEMYCDGTVLNRLRVWSGVTGFGVHQRRLV